MDIPNSQCLSVRWGRNIMLVRTESSLWKPLCKEISNQISNPGKPSSCQWLRHKILRGDMYMSGSHAHCPDTCKIQDLCFPRKRQEVQERPGQSCWAAGRHKAVSMTSPFKSVFWDLRLCMDRLETTWRRDGGLVGFNSVVMPRKATDMGMIKLSSKQILLRQHGSQQWYSHARRLFCHNYTTWRSTSSSLHKSFKQNVHCFDWGRHLSSHFSVCFMFPDALSSFSEEMLLIIIKFTCSCISLKDLFFLGDNKQFSNLEGKCDRNKREWSYRNLR